jgi:hypothetical protein
VEKFPHLVQLHQKFASRGLVVMSVDVMQSELKRKDEVEQFLEKQKASFPNFILTDGDTAAQGWMERYGIAYTPGVAIIDRSGERVAVPEDPTPEQVEEIVTKLMNK